MTTSRLDRIRVVLVRPKTPGNVGASARAMKNFGLRRLVVVDPAARGAPQHARHPEARRLAWSAGDVLDAVERAGTLAEALGPCAAVVAVSPRSLPGVAPIDPRSAARLLLAAPGEGALVFGQEDNGLLLDELALASAVLRIPTSPEYTDLNLAQSVVVVAYELYREALARRSDRDRIAPPPRPDVAAREAFFARLRLALQAIDFLRGDGEASTFRLVRRLFLHGLRSEGDLAVAEGLVHRVLLLGRRAREEDHR